MWFEPVSCPKSVRAEDVMNLLDYVSPNEAELVAMAASLRRRTEAGGAGSTIATSQPSGDN